MQDQGHISFTGEYSFMGSQLPELFESLLSLLHFFLMHLTLTAPKNKILYLFGYKSGFPLSSKVTTNN